MKHKYIIMDRDPLFSHSFRDMLKNRGVKPMRLPSRSPDLNVYAERWIGSIRRECFASVIPLGNVTCGSSSNSLSTIIAKKRNHKSLGNKLIVPMNYNAANSGRVVRRQRLGGVLSYYYRGAA